jgi:hypothetical protein
MTPAVLLERIVALQADFSAAHLRVIDALEANDLRALVEASRHQGDLCTEQGALLAEYVAVAVTERLELTPAERDRVHELARQLRDRRDGQDDRDGHDGHDQPQTKAAG